jgi:hypothetical protein
MMYVWLVLKMLDTTRSIGKGVLGSLKHYAKRASAGVTMTILRDIQRSLSSKN